ncbi:MAG: redoxin domain-containing protein [Acidobacteriota bacterium]|nr:redoxin domain-containing protein [Acidobacteriota bacterium]
MRLRERDRSGLDVIHIDIWEGTDPKPEVERFVEMWGLKGTVLLDETAEYARALGVRGVPTNLVVDEAGIVRALGVSRLDELERAIDGMLHR